MFLLTGSVFRYIHKANILWVINFRCVSISAVLFLVLSSSLLLLWLFMGIFFYIHILNYNHTFNINTMKIEKPRSLCRNFFTRMNVISLIAKVFVSRQNKIFTENIIQNIFSKRESPTNTPET